jgi:hypothetical protein
MKQLTLWGFASEPSGDGKPKVKSTWEGDKEGYKVE